MVSCVNEEPELSARAELELGDAARFFPSDQALLRIKELMPRSAPDCTKGPPSPFLQKP